MLKHKIGSERRPARNQARTWVIVPVPVSEMRAGNSQHLQPISSSEVYLWGFGLKIRLGDPQGTPGGHRHDVSAGPGVLEQPMGSSDPGWAQICPSGVGPEPGVRAEPSQGLGTGRGQIHKPALTNPEHALGQET